MKPEEDLGEFVLGGGDAAVDFDPAEEVFNVVAVAVVTATEEAGSRRSRLPDNPWNMADKLLLNLEVDGFFYWLVDGIAHYGRFTDVKPDASP